MIICVSSRHKSKGKEVAAEIRFTISGKGLAGSGLSLLKKKFLKNKNIYITGVKDAIPLFKFYFLIIYPDFDTYENITRKIYFFIL